eukprot:420415-Prymnesium_polylepis.1
MYALATAWDKRLSYGAWIGFVRLSSSYARLVAWLSGCSTSVAAYSDLCRSQGAGARTQELEAGHAHS